VRLDHFGELLEKANILKQQCVQPFSHGDLSLLVHLGWLVAVVLLRFLGFGFRSIKHGKRLRQKSTF
jgi:hypothetical protein